MKKRPVLYLLTAVYDFWRFIAFAGFWALAGVAARNSGGSLTISGGALQLDIIPIPMFLAPAALFPLMIFFLWFDYSKYRPFAPLYAAGKLIGVIAGAVWVWQNISPNLIVLMARFGQWRHFFLAVAVPVSVVLDAVFAAALLVSSRKNREEA
jgi:hypothetical protein